MFIMITRLRTLQVEAIPSQFCRNFVKCCEIQVLDFLPVKNFKEVHAFKYMPCASTTMQKMALAAEMIRKSIQYTQYNHKTPYLRFETIFS